VLAERLGITHAPDIMDSMLHIPSTQANLVYRAIDQFQQRFRIPGGFQCHLRKHIPAGAGMGGASSDAASALRCAAKLCGIETPSEAIIEIAASIGSDVPFFLGVSQEPQSLKNRGTRWSRAVRATGRGERLEAIEMTTCLHFVVVYPSRSLSTAAVYARCQIPRSPISSDIIVAALQAGKPQKIGECLCNRLSEPAKKIAPLIDEILESMWRSGLRACQLTGSGSACFAIATSASSARRCAARLQASLQPGALIKVARSTSVPTTVFIH
jgi:4-diphosphocytidyl-2-C-methyl-D-erythritol kinase